MNPACSACLCMIKSHRQDFVYWSARDARGDVSISHLFKCGHKHMKNISRTTLRITSWAFYHFIRVKLASYNINLFLQHGSKPMGKTSGWLAAIEK